MILNEDYHINMLISNKDVYIRFDKFQSGEINKLLIPGLSGSGKSTLARELAIRFNCPCIELDKFRGNIYYTDEEMKREHPYIYKYFKTEFTKGDRHNITKMEPEERREEFEKFVYWLLKQPERMVIEGALEKILYDNDEMRKTYPMVFKGTSMMKSMARMSWREFHRKHTGRDLIDNILWWLKWCTKYKKMTDQHNNIRDKIMWDVDMNDYEEREENDLPLIMEAMGYKPQPILFSDDDIYINYNKWKSGECKSVLITSISGSGKSTLAKKIAEKDHAYYIEIDIISFGIGIRRPKNANWEYIKEHDKYLYKYFKENNIAPTIMQQFKDYQDLKKNKIIDKYIYWLCFERDDLDSNRVVIEGGDVAIALSHIKELSNLPIVIKGTSLSKSLGRRMYRTIETKDNGLYKTIVNILDGTYISQYSKMYPEVNAARKSVMDQEYEEVHESFLEESTNYNISSSLKLQNKRNIFLTSAGLEDVEVRKAFLSSYDKNIKGSKVLFVTAAAIDKESIEFLKECWNDLLNININPQNIIEFNFDRHFTYNDFMRFDIVYICGGDENHLIKVINNSGMRESFIKSVNNGLVYIGVSAGACIASPYVKNGLNFIQNKVDVHYPDEEAIANGDVPPKNVQINLSNRQAVWIYGNTIQIIGSKNISESHILKHTFTHKELCDIYQNQLVTENSAIYIPHESGNITQHIPGAYFNEEVGVWMRKPNKEELKRLNVLNEAYSGYEFHPLIEAKPAWDPKLWRDPGPNIRNFDIKKELKTFMYPQAIKEKYKGPNFYINLPGLSKDKRFRVRCEMIILDSEGRMLVDMQREFKRLGLSMEFPGGGIDPGETILDAASRESKEEARVIVKDAIDTQLYYAYEVPEDSKLAYGYWGVASFICIGKYKKKYNGYIKKDDRDSFLARAEWVKPEDLKDLLPIHKQALKMYKNFYLQESLGINMEFLNNEYI